MKSLKKKKMETSKEAIEGYIVPETAVVAEDLILYLQK